MMRRLFKPLWVLLAVIFLIEAWLWDHLEPIVARVVARIPLRAFKHWLAERIDTLSPAMTLIVFVVPVILLFPLKLVGLWLLAHEYWISAITTMVFAKFLGLGVDRLHLRRDAAETAARWHGSQSSTSGCWSLRAKAAELVDPIKLRIKEIMRGDRRRLAVADAAADPALPQERARSAVSSCCEFGLEANSVSPLPMGEVKSSPTSDAPHAARTGRSP